MPQELHEIWISVLLWLIPVDKNKIINISSLHET